MQSSEVSCASRNEFQYSKASEAMACEPVIQNVWSTNHCEDKSEPSSVHNNASDGEANFSFTYERPTMLNSSGSRLANTDGGKISYIHIAPKLDGRRLSYSGSMSENTESSPSNSPESSGVTSSHIYGDSSSPNKVGFSIKTCLFTGSFY